MAPKARNYTVKDVDMLITASTITETAIANKVFLQSKRATWADPFFDDIKAIIDIAIQTHLGIDSAKDLRQATIALKAIQKNAIKDLAECKVQITEDFKANKIRRTEILTQLGFTTYHKDAQKGDQEALINLLFQFKTNLTAPLKTEISDAGTPAVLLTAITSYADALKNADVTQETFKGSRKTITAAALAEFNSIYDKIISVCKIARKFYKDEPALQSQFSFSKVSKALNIPPPAPPAPLPA
jgi:hypothetical protein